MASIISAGTTSGTALNLTGDTSGQLALATNNGTTAVTIGTNQVATFVTDASISGLTVGKGGGAVVTNTSVGAAALNAVNTGGYCSAFGYNALAANTSGFINDAFGYSTLLVNTNGSYNSAFGTQALNANTSGSNNVALGYSASRTNTTGGGNVCVGYNAGYTSQLAANNTFIGYQAGYTSNPSGTTYGNTCVGAYAGYNLTTGVANNFLGGSGYAGSGYAMTTGSYNVIIGGFSGNSGGLDIRTASNYIVLSDGAGNPRGVFDNSGNFTVGTVSATDRSGTTAKICAVAVGLQDGIYFQSNSNSYFAAVSHVTTTSGTRYQMGFGDGTTWAERGTISTNGTSTSYNTASDYRLKENVKPMTGALAKVSAFKPVTYTWKETGTSGEGFIAHELAEVCPDAVVGEKDGLKEDGTPQYQQIDTSFLVATLTAAIQEQQALITQLQADVAALKGAK